MNRESMDQPEGIDCNVALSATHLLAGIVSPGPPFSVVLTDWLSRTAVLGECSWPKASRSSSRSASWTRSKVPFSLQCRKWNQTTLQGGKSCGSIRHEHLALAWYKMAFQISRSEYFLGRPVRPFFAGGRTARIFCHYASARSVG